MKILGKNLFLVLFQMDETRNRGNSESHQTHQMPFWISNGAWLRTSAAGTICGRCSTWRWSTCAASCPGAWSTTETRSPRWRGPSVRRHSNVERYEDAITCLSVTDTIGKDRNLIDLIPNGLHPLPYPSRFLFFILFLSHVVFNWKKN